MSRFQERVLECPVCNVEFPARIWSSVNVTLDPQLKDEVMEGRLNRVICSACGFSGRSPDPFLYHDMDKKMMFYVAEGADAGVLRAAVQSMREEQTAGGMPLPAIYMLDNTESLVSLIYQLDHMQNPDGSIIENLAQDEWKELVDILIAPVHPWPLDHKCICGAEIRTLCFCTKDGVRIDVRKHEPELTGATGFECPHCGRGLVAFHCEKCNRLYSWLEGVVEHVADQQYT
jgi:transcription elongation factor Elf1